MSAEVLKSSQQQIVEHWSAELSRLVRETGVIGAVVYISLDDEKFAALRSPGCSDECDNPDKCQAQVYLMASEDLHHAAHDLENRKPKERVWKS